MFELFALSLRDDVLQTRDIIVLSLDHGVTGVDLLLNRSLLSDESIVLLFELGFLSVLLLFLGILDRDLLLKLVDLLGHSLEFHFELSDLVFSLEQVLRVEVTVGPDRLIQVQLGLESGLLLDVLLLELGNQIVLQFDLFQALVVLSVGLGGLDTVLLLFFRKVTDDDTQAFRFSFAASDLICLLGLLVLEILLLSLDESLVGFSGHNIIVKQLALSDLLLNVLLKCLGLSLQSLVLILDFLVPQLQSVKSHSIVLSHSHHFDSLA